MKILNSTCDEDKMILKTLLLIDITAIYEIDFTFYSKSSEYNANLTNIYNNYGLINKASSIIKY